MTSPTLFVLLAAAAGPQGAQPEPATPKRHAVIGYVFPQERLLAPGEIDAARLTHINYAFANVRDGRVVEGFAHDAENLRVLTGLRAANPQLRILVSVGGWTWSKAFSDAALTPASRQRFCESALDYVRRHDLDGFDVDWEYPGLPGDKNPHRPEDRENFTALMRELRAHLDRLSAATGGRRYLLTFAAGAFPDYLAHTAMGDVHPFVDYVNLMTYDFRVPGAEPEAGHNANLLAHPSDTNGLSVERAVRDFLAAGVPAGKLVLGVPFYGRAWEVRAPSMARSTSRARPPPDSATAATPRSAISRRSPAGSAPLGRRGASALALESREEALRQLRGPALAAPQVPAGERARPGRRHVLGVLRRQGRRAAADALRRAARYGASASQPLISWTTGGGQYSGGAQSTKRSAPDTL